MKQDKAEAQAIANTLFQRLQAFPPLDRLPEPCLAPDMVLFGLTTLPTAPAELMGPREKGVPNYIRAKLAEQREFFANKSSSRIHSGAVDAEWSRMPVHWRIVMLMMGGVGDVDSDMHHLASRSWQIIPPAERDGIRAALREAFAVLQPTHALRMRTTS